MTVFDVFVNGRKLCRAGVGDDGVLAANLTWVRLAGPARQDAKRRRRPSAETRLHVGGLASGTHRKWAGRMLKVGDQVTIRVVSASAFDPPVQEKPQDPSFREREERKYYLRLKRKYDRPSSRKKAVQAPSGPPNKRMQLTRSAMAKSRRGPRS